MGLKLNATNGGGSIELNVPNTVNSDLEVTIPATAGEVAVKDSNGNLELTSINSLNYPTVGPLSNRNLIINGAMQVAQRSAAELNNVASSAGLTYQTLDRWGYWSNASNLFSSNQVEDAPPGFYHSVQLKSLGNNSMGSGGYNTWSQRFEAHDLYRTGIGTANAKDLILSFWVKASTAGTYGFHAMNSSWNYIFTSTYTVNAANTWEYKTITIPGPTSNFSETGNARQLEIGFTLGAGTTYSTSTLNQWQSGNFLIGATGAINLVETIDETLNLTGVQLEVGSKATPFEHRSYGDELARCQRYFYTHLGTDATTDGIGNGAFWQSNQIYVAIHHPVTMRSTPVFSNNISALTPGFIRIFGAGVASWNQTGSTFGTQRCGTNCSIVYLSDFYSNTSGTGVSVVTYTPGHAGWLEVYNDDLRMDFNAEL